ncbi:aminotransferase [Sphingobium sufflavum]|uniref:aminotransferase n=1 Tax=Sphingobium sufflavum TaxID=1129547 RepID=UPI001F179169|nr:aminotransferase [Sphingobium sufflavum]MCE7796774.1 aminotransferase [Sphingobium sufflavum]
MAATTIFERMSRLAQELGAINLGQGYPDFPEPPELIAAAARAVTQRSNQYPPMRGLPDLRHAIADYYARTQGLDLQPEEVVVTSGATEALAASFLALVQPGDEVILVQPLYDAYLPLVRRAGGVARLVELTPPDWSLSIAALEAAIGPRTRVLVLNTPNNPTGTLLDRATLAVVGALCERHDLILICDEVWEAMLLDGSAHVAPMQVEALRRRTVKIGSAGKIFSLTGWKVGWACAAPPLADAIAAQHQFLTFTTATPLQWAVAEGLALDEDWHRAHRAIYAGAKARFVTGMERAGYRLLPASGTWFVTVDLAASGLPVEDAALAERMVREAGVASIPCAAFYADRASTGYLRLCFVKGDAVLDAAVERLAVFREALGREAVGRDGTG